MHRDAGRTRPDAQRHPSASPASRPTPTRARPSAKRPITLAFGGDVHFEGSVRTHLLTDWRTVFGDLAPVLRRADLAVVNLETANTERGTPAEKTYVFRAPPRAPTWPRSRTTPASTTGPLALPTRSPRAR